MTLFYRKENGFGKAAAFLLVTQSGLLANRTMLEMKIVCLSTKVIRNGVITIVTIPSISNLCVKSMLEINQQVFLFVTFNVAQHVDE